MLTAICLIEILTFYNAHTTIYHVGFAYNIVSITNV